MFYVSKLFLQDQSWLSDRSLCKCVASENFGHILIRFPYTVEYQTLEIDETNSDGSETFNKLKIAVQVLLE